ncbi:unnamed protein product [Rhizoctonia solani]|uniref:Nephrocystin 3-like N-terminal domain-containing protein n=1 Tax=Rhizoctonia solani TaxID=456999 RepID=A0A8H2ZVZ2_9AGAM|nr:unnamed protein product [Rhizoctonia solani]
MGLQRYQLGRFSNPYRKELCEVLRNNRDISKREIPIQFEKLIARPLSKVKDAIPDDVVIVIDALDECSDPRDTQQVLDLLLSHATSLPVKFFVTSRPEPGISNKVQSLGEASPLVLQLHKVEASLVQADIQTYLEREVRPIKAQPEDIKQLTARAGCLFIYAATVVRYIEPQNRAANHRNRLATIISAHPGIEGDTYEELDKLYSSILSQALEYVKGEERELLRLSLRTIIGAREPLTISTLAEMTNNESEEAVRLALSPLHSVLRVSDDTKVISTLHASFPEFMLSAERSKEFHCDMPKQNMYMAAQCFSIMKRRFQFNICNLETSSRFDKEISDLETRLDEAISPGLFYACRYWASHLCGSEFFMRVIDMLDEFLCHRLLFWMEVLNLKGWIGQAPEVLLQVFNSLPTDDYSISDLQAMIQDSRNFVTIYATNPTSNSTPHICLSALPFAPTNNRVREVYWPRTKGLVTIERTGVNDGGNVLLATWATGPVNGMALSKDGKRIASVADDGIIGIWDTSEGRRVLGPLKRHRKVVCSVVFSPNGNKLASGSSDSTIYISSAYTGDILVGPLRGHTASISFLSYTTNGSYLASASEDQTVRIWNPFTGVQTGTVLRGHQDCVMCVLFSSGGDRLFSCSNDRTIRIWDWRLGKTIFQLTDGHTSCIDCIALSPDEAYIASSSRDCTVHIWCVQSRQTVLGPLKGHTDRVKSVAYSPDGKRIVSGAFDRTIRVWSSETGDLIAGPFTGHGGEVYSVMFSIDGKHILSCSEDKTICIWDASYSTSETDPEMGVYFSSIVSVAFSPDGNRAVSGCTNGTIFVWDIHTGSLILGPLRDGTSWVSSVAYTPDGGYILSLSDDCRVHTWDAQTGLLLGHPLTDHHRWTLSVAISPDSKLIASGSQDCSVRLWELRTGTAVGKPLVKHTGWVQSVDFSPDGSRVVFGSDDATGHAHKVTVAKFTPDGQKIVSFSVEEKFLLWDATTGGVPSNLWQGESTWHWDVSLSADGAMFASKSENDTIGLWDIHTGSSLAPRLQGHTEGVFSVEFSPDSKHVISGSWDGTIRIWNVESAKNLKGKENNKWVVNDDGWMTDSESKPVLWIPVDLRDRLPIAPCSLIAGPQQSIRVNPDGIIFGGHWGDCYIPSADSQTPNI